MSTEVKVTYFHHSGFSAAVGTTLLVFDYWRGDAVMSLKPSECLNERDLTGFGRVLFFVSHAHPDHYDPVIYDFAKLPNVTYIISDDLPAEARGERIREGQTRKIGKATVTAFGSTDPGVSFYVEIEGVCIFHAGDLNLWHWREDSSLKQINYAEEEFYRKVDAIKGMPIDLCMFPVDPRMRRMFEAGANHFIMACKPRVFIPMHWHGRAEVAEDYSQQCCTKYTKGLALVNPREYADILYQDDNSIKIVRYLTGKKVSTARQDPEAVDFNRKQGQVAEDDPFAESDLPVEHIAQHQQEGASEKE